MLLDRPIPKALFYSHVRLEAKRNALDALSCFGTDRQNRVKECNRLFSIPIQLK